jgi:uncharacterized membrane protein
MAASNLGLIPYSAPIYGTIAGILVPVAIPLLLMRADMKAIFTESGPMLLAFVIAATATVVGAVVGAWLIDMGPLEAEIVGTITSSYIGGSLNFVATAEAVGIKDSSIYVASLSADAVGAVFFLLLLMLMPAVRYIRNAMPSKFIGQQADTAALATNVNEVREVQPLRLVSAATGLAISLVICALSAAITSMLEMESLFILVVTALTLLVANFAKPVVRHVSSEFELGTLFMYIFFVAIGAGANLGEVLGAAMPIIAFIIAMVLVHLCLLVIIGKWLKLDLAEVLIASNACILGPAPAAAPLTPYGLLSQNAPLCL